jgi:hypothetical protein
MGGTAPDGAPSARIKVRQQYIEKSRPLRSAQWTARRHSSRQELLLPSYPGTGGVFEWNKTASCAFLCVLELRGVQ